MLLMFKPGTHMRKASAKVKAISLENGFEISHHRLNVVYSYWISRYEALLG